MQGGKRSAFLRFFTLIFRLFQNYGGKRSFPLRSAYFSAYFPFLTNFVQTKLLDLCFFPRDFSNFFPSGEKLSGTCVFLGVSFFTHPGEKYFLRNLNLFNCFHKKNFDHLEEKKTCQV